jgi:transcriptional regulator with XRE-family HTH domain
MKIAVALRTGRTAIGWNQHEFAQRLNVATSTIARIETLETTASTAVVMDALDLLRKAGVTIDLTSEAGVVFHVTPAALKDAEQRLLDEQARRPERKKAKGKPTEG